jgi:hypothetical protein
MPTEADDIRTARLDRDALRTVIADLRADGRVGDRTVLLRTGNDIPKPDGSGNYAYPVSTAALGIYPCRLAYTTSGRSPGDVVTPHTIDGTAVFPANIGTAWIPVGTYILAFEVGSLLMVTYNG